jgi:chromosome segregation ATPase
MSPSEYQDLVAFLGERFQLIDRRFESIDPRFEQLEGQLATLRDDMLAHFDQLYQRLERLELEYQAIVQTLRRIEAGLGDRQRRQDILERDLARMRENLAVLTARIDEIERRLRT